MSQSPRRLKPVEVPVSPLRDAPPPLDDDLPRSSLSVVLDHVERGRASEEQLLRMCAHPLDAISARDAQRAVALLTRGRIDAKRERAIGNLLASL